MHAGQIMPFSSSLTKTRSLTLYFVKGQYFGTLLCGDRIPLMDSSPDIKECCRDDRLRFKKGTRHGSWGECNSRSNPVVNVSGSTTPSTRP